MPDIEQGDKNYYAAMGYDYDTGVPSYVVLEELDLGYVAEALKSKSKPSAAGGSGA